jgi:hypothetical protein
MTKTARTKAVGQSIAAAVGIAGVRKPGRPRKYGQGRINATVRFTAEDYEKLRTAADAKGRSISEEVEARVGTSLLEEKFKDLRDALEKAQTLNEEMIERAVTRALARTRLIIGGEDS